MENNVLEIDVLGPEETSAMLSRLDEEGVDIEGYVAIEPEYSSLTSSILRTFTKNRDAKRSSGIEDEIFTCLRDFNGEYSASDLSRIQEEGGSNIFMNLTATKVRAAQSWIRDILLSPNEDPFTIKPTPIPSLPEDLDSQLEDAFTKEFLQKKSEVTQEGQQPPTPKQVQDTISTLNRDKRDVRDAVLEEINLEALEQMKIMERKIKDDLKEGKWEDALSEFIEDFCIFPAAIMKGPVITKKEKLVWEAGVPIVKEDFLFLNKRVNPIDVYPDPSGSCVQDGDFIEHMRLSKIELYSLKGIKGYNSEAIDKVLESNNDGSCWFDTGIESEKAEEEKRGDMIDANDGIFHALHYWGVAKTEDIEDWGLVIPDTEDENKYWEIEAILVGTEVIKCKLNDDPLKRRPYYKASYQNIPGAFWGRSLPSLMRDIQRMCNACARALASNMGLAAGPQIELYIDRLADAGDIEEIKPLKIWQVTNDPTGAQGRAINFFQVPSIANELLGVYEKFEQKADDATGIPRYSYGNERMGGAAQTAAGLSMLLESATKSIKDAIRHIDVGLIIPRVEYQFFWNIIKNKIPYTGDIDVLALGSSTLTMKGAQTAKRQEFLQITANENDQKLMGPEGRAELLRQLGKDLGLTTKIVPSRLELRKKIEEEKAQQQQMMEMQAQQQQGGANASLEATRMQIEGQERMHQQTQAIKAKELELKEMKDIDNALLEREKLGLMKEANIQRAAVASEGNQIKQNIARTQVAANLVGRNANS